MNSKINNYVKQIALLACTLFLCAALMGPSCLGGGKVFSHNNHVKKQNLACEDCHAGSENGILAGAPSTDICATCHEEADKYKGIADEAARKWPRIEVLSADGIFSHKNHADKGVKCEDCHGNMAKSRVTGIEDMPAMEDCMACHAKKGVSTACQTCHKETKRETAPADHSKAWEKSHGQLARDPKSGGRCLLCHEQNKCASCHNSQKPQDHTLSWKEFGHGIESGMDRGRCATCHRSDFCVKCHRSTPPSSHRGDWGENHCGQCHISGGGGQNCSVCHGASMSHRQAPEMPDGQVHDHATDCRSCHNGFLMPHPDNGENCRICHDR